MGPIQDLARETGAHIMLVHHANKKSGDDVMDTILGSNGLTGAVDTVLAIQEGKNRVRTLSSRGRYDGLDMEETVLTFHRENRSCSLGNTVQEEMKIAKSAARDDLHERIIGFIDLNQGCTEKQVEGGVIGSTEAITRALRELRDTHLHVEGDGRRGSPYRHYTEVPTEK